MTKISKTTNDFLDENPSGKLEDLPKEMKNIFDNIFNKAVKIVKEKK